METFVSERDGEILVVSADGGLNRDTAHQLIASVARHVDSGARSVVVDCSRLQVISSAGIGVLLQLHRDMKARGASVRLAGLQGLVAQALRLTRLDGFFELFPDVNAAKLAFRPES
jgi:anti-sigma B factor antagonist